MKKQLWVGMIGFLILALALGGWWIWRTSQSPLKVKAGAVAPISMQKDVYANGNVVPVSSQEVRVLTPGRVSNVAVKVGESVQVGQTLVTLDTTLVDAQVAQAKVNVEAAQTSVNAAQANLEELQKAQSASATGSAGGLSPTVIKQAEGVLAQSKAALKQAQEMLKVAKVQQGQMIYKAALAGTVLEVNAEAGNLSSVQLPLVVVADLSQMNVEAQLNEVDAGKVKVGGKATITSKVLGDTSVQGTIIEIAPVAVTKPSVQGNASPTVGIKIRLDQVSAGLRPGFTVSLKIILETKEGILAVPQEALFQEGNKNYVYRIQEGRLRKTEVKLGIGNDTHQEITSGLNAGDQVVLNPSKELLEGMAVAPETGSGGG
ncbi:putative Co/Zn/Cd efflux system membrane fusion protein [Desulfosporosinus sp. I2]|uniref:efflux RND transporter periplasmic adaptor subunit n=1 Tax=Desulfosporosinus sp. I2 TaxID=1617025 RepID=UPI0005EF49F3|nr:efflux RND transporter periplasmic adaptor subunit [Desulfosporosinus sp. I2]KJR49328.1 putative Co/Zn/Cd efflux system membrane fusion protein [Desulfosporosinus sp. I2]